MKIRTRLRLITLATLAVAIAVAAVVISTNRQMTREQMQIENAQLVLEALFRLRGRTFEYLLRPEARPKAQWHAEQQEIARRLQALAVATPVEEAIADYMRQDLQQSLVIFGQLEKLGAKAEEAGGREILSGQLQLKIQSVASGMLRLEDLMRKRIAETQQQATILGTALMALLVMSIATGALLLARSILGPLDALRKGADIVGAGNLEYRTGLATRDEIGDLSKAFERMTESLQQLTARARHTASYTRSLIEASLDPLVTISPEGRITDVNEATIRATGVGRDVLIGSDFSDYFTEPDKARAGYREVFASGLVKDYPLSLRHASGEVMEVLYNASLYRDEKGEVAGVFAAARDVTERKHAEEELRKYHEQLEARVRERTAELEAVNRDLEEIIYSLAHDLGIPVRAVDGFAHALLAGYHDRLDAEGKRYLNIVRDNTRRMGRLIEDILAFARLRGAAMNIANIDMEQLARAALDDLRPSTAGRIIEIGITPLPFAHGDAAMLRQVWVNLLSNAIKFTRPKPAARIEIEGKIEGAECVYSIKDNGVGFDQQYVHKLFGVFQRLHGIEEFEGTGIGLAIVKRIITRHGGRIWAEGKLDEGAAFHFALPI